MRESKIRIWDGKEYRYSPPFGEWDFEDFELFAGYNPRAEATELYTGLKDRTGKEIYEGDVVKTAIGDWLVDIYEVGYCDGYWFPMVQVEYGYNAIDKYHAGDFEIIGNIHENPELLK